MSALLGITQTTLAATIRSVSSSRSPCAATSRHCAALAEGVSVSPTRGPGGLERLSCVEREGQTAIQLSGQHQGCCMCSHPRFASPSIPPTSTSDDLLWRCDWCFLISNTKYSPTSRATDITLSGRFVSPRQQYPKTQQVSRAANCSQLLPLSATIRKRSRPPQSAPACSISRRIVGSLTAGRGRRLPDSG